MSCTWNSNEVQDGILSVVIDRPEQSVNSLSRSVLEELAELITRIRRDPTIRGVLFRSGKPGNFIVGADVHELRELEGADRARELSQFGQGVFQQLCELPSPSVALISGVCLGGGLEFALACTYRVVDNDRKTLLGFPEVKLGLIPGWGGTVRSPRLVGLSAAIPMILAGQQLNGRQAVRKGLAHAAVPTEALDGVGSKIIRSHLEKNLDNSARAAGRLPDCLQPPRRRPWWKRALGSNGLYQRFVLSMAGRQVLRKTHGHYPAPARAIAVLRAGLLESPAAGFEAESQAIAELASHPVTAELMRLFFLREQVKQPPADIDIPADTEAISQAAVLGAGAMGAGIARIMAQRGIWVRLKDISPEYLAGGMRTMRNLLRSDLRRGRLTPRQAEMTTDHLSPTIDYRGLRRAQIVIEAVVEDLAIKRKVFRELAEATGPQTVLATNTSSLLVSEIAREVPHPERVIGLHFFNPPHQMPLVEVVRTELTNPRTVALALALVERLGKVQVVVRDCAGFLVNRLLAPYMNEVGYLLAEGVEPMEIERAAVAFGFPMGPLELTDLVGASVAAHVAENLYQAFGERLKPAPLWQDLKELNAGTKSGPDRLITCGWRGKRLNRSVARLIARHSQKAHTRPHDREALTARLVYPIINEAARCLDERIVERPEMVDLAMVFGSGFAPFRGGPLRYADSIGLDKVVETLERLAGEHERLAPCESLRRRAAEGAPFFDPQSLAPSARVA